MRRRIGRPSVTLAIVLFIWGSQVGSAPLHGLRRFTASDAIELTRFSKDTNVATSPDGRYSIVQTNTADLATNQLKSALWELEGEEVAAFLANMAAAPKPRLLFQAATQADAYPIEKVHWSDDSRELIFVAEEGGIERHLMTIDVADGHLTRLSTVGQDVTDFAGTRDSLVYTSTQAQSAAERYQSISNRTADIEIGTGSSLNRLLFPADELKTLGLTSEELWLSRQGHAAPVVDSRSGSTVSLVNSRVVSVSPDGRFVVATTYAKRVPMEWEAYEAARRELAIVADAAGSPSKLTTYRPQQYSLIDVRSGTVKPLVAAPIGWGAGYFTDVTRALWINGSSELVLTNTYVADDAPAASRPEHLRPCVAAVEVQTARIECLLERPEARTQAEMGNACICAIDWQPAAQRLTIALGRNREKRAFVRTAAGWQRSPSSDREAPTAGSAAALSIQEGLDLPPVLMAQDRRGGRQVLLWDPNPQLAAIDRGAARVFRWHDRANREWEGGLVLPPGYQAGRLYPLVLQTHGFDEQEFLVDGASATAESARALAAREIVVLQIAEPAWLHPSPSEAQTCRDGYEAAVRALASQRLIDTDRVGIIGWSRTGWYVLESLITAPRLFAVATLAESTHGDLSQYRWLTDYSLGPVLAESIAEGIGGLPTGAGLSKWFQRSPEFNTALIQVPVLFEQNSPSALIYGWSLYAALRSEGKPVELLYIRSGDHSLIKPAQRLASQEMNVDWYDFWLNAHQDPDPAKAGQYARWRELRERKKAQTRAASVR